MRAPDERLESHGIERLCPLKERHRDCVGARREPQPEVRPRVDLVGQRRQVLQAGFEIILPTERDEVHAPAVDAELELMRVLEAAHNAQVRPEHPGLEVVLRIERQRHLGQDAADGADGQPLDVRVLRCVLADPERLGRGSDVPSAHRERRDLAGRCEIALKQNGRDTERVADVVKAVRGIVGRQHRRDVHVKRQQIMNRVGVLDAIEPPDQRTTGIGGRNGRAIEFSRQVGDESLARRGIGPRGVLRRHHADADLANRFFPDVERRGDSFEVQRVQTQPGRLRPLVVTADTVLAHNRCGVRSRHRRGVGGVARCGRQGLREDRPADERRGRDHTRDTPPPAHSALSSARSTHTDSRNFITA